MNNQRNDDDRSTHAATSHAATMLIVILLGALALDAAACKSGADAEDAPWTDEELALIGSLSPIPALPESPSNPVADDDRAAKLGQALFFDKRLSKNGEVSCESCHKPDRYFADTLALSRGIGTTKRHAPALVGAQWAPFLFWDGRKDSLWSQALGPLEHPDEHGMTRTELARVLQSHYKADYEALFGPMPDVSDKTRFPDRARPVMYEPRHPHSTQWKSMSESDRATVDTIVANAGRALEAYQRKLLPRPAAFDRYVEALRAGDPKGGGHLNVSARRGLRAFVGKGQCVNCHNSPLLTDNEFHNLGLPSDPYDDVDMGRYLGAVSVKRDDFRCGSPVSGVSPDECAQLRFLNPKFEDFKGGFKTPSLRNVAKTAPYMHDGQFGTLAEVIAFYKTLPGRPRVGHRELVLELLDASVGADDLIAFLEALTGDLPDAQWLQKPATPGTP